MLMEIGKRPLLYRGLRFTDGKHAAQLEAIS